MIIERANHSIDLITRVRLASNGRFQVIAGQHGGLSKEQRFESIQHKINTGQVFLAQGANGIDLFLSELRGFPYGASDDLVDSFTMALKEWKKALEELFGVAKKYFTSDTISLCGHTICLHRRK